MGAVSFQRSCCAISYEYFFLVCSRDVFLILGHFFNYKQVEAKQLHFGPEEYRFGQGSFV